MGQVILPHREDNDSGTGQVKLPHRERDDLKDWQPDEAAANQQAQERGHQGNGVRESGESSKREKEANNGIYNTVSNRRNTNIKHTRDRNSAD